MSKTPSIAPHADNQEDASSGKPLATCHKRSKTHPRKRVVLSKHQLATILKASKATHNDQVIALIQKAVNRSFVTEETPKRERCEAPPDAALANRVKELECKAAELSSGLVNIRRQASKKLLSQTQADLKESIKEHLEMETTPLPPASPPLPSTLKPFSEKLAEIPKSIKKIKAKIADTKRRVQNVSTVLQHLKRDEKSETQDDVSLSINADWTINVNDVNI